MSVNPSAGVEKRFVTTMNRLIKAMSNAVVNASTPQEVVHLLNVYAQSQEYKDWCEKLALNITTQVNKGVSKTWREAAEKAGRGSEIYKQILAELRNPSLGVFWLKVKENALLIKKIPLSISQSLTSHIAVEASKGRRATDILGDLIKQFPNKAKSRLKLIARTEVSKTQTALIQSRAAAMGTKWYIWRTSDDQRVRKSHEKMEGVLVNWDDPPSPEALAGEKNVGKYHAGDIYNCRCYPEPIVNLDYVVFPAKVYYNGSIRRMSRKQFEKIAA